MDRIIEERRVGTHHVTIIEELADDGAGYLLVIDGVLAADAEPLSQIPSDEELHDFLRARGLL